MPAALCHLHCLLYLRKELNWEEIKEDILMHLSATRENTVEFIKQKEIAMILRLLPKVAHLNGFFKKEKEKSNVFTPPE